MAAVVTQIEQVGSDLDRLRDSLIGHVSRCDLLRFVDIADVRDCQDKAEHIERIDECRYRLLDGLLRNRLRPVTYSTEREIAPGFVLIELYAITEWIAPCSNLTTVS